MPRLYLFDNLPLIKARGLLLFDFDTQVYCYESDSPRKTVLVNNIDGFSAHLSKKDDKKMILLLQWHI
jgi:hypothetical protein